MILKTRHVTPIVLAVFVAGIGGTMAFNLWRTESSKQPARYTSGEFAGQVNPGDIRGSYSFSDIDKAFGVPVADLARAFGVEGVENLADFKVKGLEDMYAGIEGGEVGTDSVRLFVALYRNLPYTPEEDTRLPAAAVEVLQESLKDRLSAEQLEAIKEKALSIGGTKPAEQAAAAEEHEASEDRTLKGKTVFQELLDRGLTKEEIEGVLGVPMGRPNVAVRDYLAEKQIEFSTVKTRLQELVDGKK